MSDTIRFLSNPTNLEFDPYDCGDAFENGISLLDIFDDELTRFLWFAFRCRNVSYRDQLRDANGNRAIWRSPDSGAFPEFRKLITELAKRLRKEAPITVYQMPVAGLVDAKVDKICLQCYSEIVETAFPYICAILDREGLYYPLGEFASVPEFKITVNGQPFTYQRSSVPDLCDGCGKRMILSPTKFAHDGPFCSDDCRARKRRLDPETPKTRRIIFESDLPSD